MSVWRRLGMASAVGLWVLASVSSVGAQVPREEPRLALVIGNSAGCVAGPLEGARGVGNRTDDAARPGSLTFVK